MSTRIYLDFDGVVAYLDPAGKRESVVIDGITIPLHRASLIRHLGTNPDLEIIWASHWEEEVYFYTDQLDLPRHPHLVFTDPTGSKVKDIVAHYQANPCDSAAVWEDSLTSAEIRELNQSGIDVLEFCNTFVVGRHPAGGEA